MSSVFQDLLSPDGLTPLTFVTEEGTNYPRGKNTVPKSGGYYCLSYGMQCGIASGRGWLSHERKLSQEHQPKPELLQSVSAGYCEPLTPMSSHYGLLLLVLLLGSLTCSVWELTYWSIPS